MKDPYAVGNKISRYIIAIVLNASDLVIIIYIYEENDETQLRL